MPTQTQQEPPRYTGTFTHLGAANFPTCRPRALTRRNHGHRRVGAPGLQTTSPASGIRQPSHC